MDPDPFGDVYQRISSLYSCRPFKAEGNETYLDAIERTKLKFREPIWKAVDKTAKSLLLRLLHMDPARRTTAKELLDDPWVSGWLAVWQFGSWIARAGCGGAREGRRLVEWPHRHRVWKVTSGNHPTAR